MTTYTYPAGDFDRWRSLMGVLGSFWNELFEDRAQLRSLAEGRAQLGAQTLFELMDLFDAMSRYRIPILHRQNWYVLYLRESECNSVPAVLPGYGDGDIYGGPRIYGQAATTQYAFPAPADLAEAYILVNRFTDPSLVWYRDADFRLDTQRHTISFRQNPFTNPCIPKRDIYDGSQRVDREAAIWLFRGQFDWEQLYYQLGYVLGMRLKSSEGYRELLNAVMDAVVGGTAERDIVRGVAAITGIPLTVEPAETIVHIQTDHQHLLVITDQHVYRFAPACVPVVAVGETVRAGDALVDALQFYWFNRGEVPADLPALVVDRGFHSSCLYGDLLFENREVPLEVEEHVDGFTKVTFGLGGFALDVEAFFDEMHRRGVAASTIVLDPDCEDTTTLIEYPAAYPDGEDAVRPASTWRRKGTLAHFLDQRATPIGEPTAASLPATINPLRFLIENVLRNNAFAVHIKAKGLGPAGLGLHNIRFLQKIVPPRTAMLIIVEMTPREERVTIDGVDDSNLGTFDAIERVSDPLPVEQVDDTRLSIRLISVTCQ